MAESEFDIRLISDFNLANLASLLRKDAEWPVLRPSEAPFGNIFQSLAGAAAPGASPTDAAIVWTRPEAIAPSFLALLDSRPVVMGDLLAEVDQFADLLLQFASGVRFLFVPSWVTPSHQRDLTVFASGPEVRPSQALLLMNGRLVERLGAASGVHVFDASRWMRRAAQGGDQPKLWYMAKIPFGNDVFKAAVADLKAALRGRLGRARKLLVLDLDDTLWGGVVGETGWHGLALGGHDPRGEAFVDFQAALKRLTRRGVVLAIASKNDEATALKALDEHPEMVLRREDFAAWRIDWSDKAQNLAALVSELNLGLESAVFIDNSPVERDRVRSALPEVFVPDWPADPMLYRASLESLSCFDAPPPSDEDERRAVMYDTERTRKREKAGFASLDEWLETLDLEVETERLGPANLRRAAQLFNKTNQMNLRTRRLPEAELAAWAGEGDRAVWTFRVRDRFGDHGLTGLVGVEIEREEARVVDFVLSCRVFGLRIEETMLSVAARHAVERGCAKLVARYVATERNGPCLEFWQARSGFARGDDSDCFVWDLLRPIEPPSCITLREGSGS